MSWIVCSKRLVVLAGAVTALGCGKAAPRQTVPSQAVLASPEARNAQPAAIAPASPASPTAALGIAAEASPTTPAPAAVQASIALVIDAGVPGDAGAAARVGKPVKIRTWPIDAKGQVIRDLDPVVGASLVLVSLRVDGSWAEVQTATKLSDPVQGRHEFTVTFPNAGSHILYVLFRPRGAGLVTVPSFIRVDGDAKESPGVGQPHARDRLANGSEVQLLYDPAPLTACAPTLLASQWLRQGKAVHLIADALGAGVQYLAVDTGLSGLTLAEALPPPRDVTANQAQPLPLGQGDIGSEAKITFPHPGYYHVMALGTPVGKGPAQIAHFLVDVLDAANPSDCAR